MGLYITGVPLTDRVCAATACENVLATGRVESSIVVVVPALKTAISPEQDALTVAESIDWLGLVLVIVETPLVPVAT